MSREIWHEMRVRWRAGYIMEPLNFALAGVLCVAKGLGLRNRTYIVLHGIVTMESGARVSDGNRLENHASITQRALRMYSQPRMYYQTWSKFTSNRNYIRLSVSYHGIING